ncbi:MAG: LodA/GoxA family CTQ-dependent oxidase, partial [Chloroflexota bacterium]
MNRRTLLSYGLFGVAASATGTALGGAGPSAIAADGEIERCVIHPAFGSARVGDSPTEWFLGPETGGPHPIPADGFKDPEGRIKRQAARFRIYGLDREDRVVREITAAEADITWTVHLANAKSAWYDFDTAFDIPGAEGRPRAPMQDAPDPLESEFRNSGIRDRSRLTIDPGARSITGTNTNADGLDRAARFDSGKFLGTSVYLGALRTDSA